MEFAKYYNVTSKLEKMIESGVLNCYEKGLYKGLFICSDTHDFWVSRILEGYNKEFEKEDGKWLVERNKLDKYAFCEFVKELKNDDSHIGSRYSRDYFIDKCFNMDEIIEFVIRMDDTEGLEGWDNNECDSYDDCIKVIDGGYGILELETTK